MGLFPSPDTDIYGFEMFFIKVGSKQGRKHFSIVIIQITEKFSAQVGKVLIAFFFAQAGIRGEDELMKMMFCV